MRFAILALCAFAVQAADPLNDIRNRAARLESERNWDAAAAVYEEALRQSTGSVSDQVWLLTSLAEMSFNSADYPAAKRRLKQAATLLGDRPGHDSAWAQLLNASGSLHLVEGKISAAEKDLTRAAESARKANARSLLAGSLHNLAGVEAQSGRLPQAEAHEREALSIWTHEPVQHHEEVLRAWISLSSIQALQSDWAAAAQSLQQSLAIRETAEALANYAVILDRLKRGDEAKEVRKRIAPVTASNQLVDVKTLGHENNRLRVVAK